MMFLFLFILFYLNQQEFAIAVESEALPGIANARNFAHLERALSEQDEMSDLRHLVGQMFTFMTNQQELLQGQSEVLAKQKLQLEKQSSELASLKRLLQKLSAELAYQRRLLQKQADQAFKSLPTRAGFHQRADDLGPLEAVVNQLSHQMTTSAADLQALQTSVSQQGQLIQDARTSTFVRWGNSQCGSASELVYSGVVGGSHFTESGAATNYLCLTLNPIPADPKQHFAHLYGAEYETADAVFEKDPLCAVCRTAFSSTVMIPGTNVCTPGWHPQYSGYLMAGYYGHPAGSEFICVDSALQYMVHSDQNENGKMLFYTSAVCGSLPCSPYVNGTTVSCVVCSK